MSDEITSKKEFLAGQNYPGRTTEDKSIDDSVSGTYFP